MNGFIRKMCILKELKKGFSADGSPLGGVTRVETFADRVTLQISLINFAPLSEGRYICVLCDKEGERLLFPLSPGINEYRTENKTFDAEKGFCCLIVFAFRDDAQCVAGGQYGGGSYSMKLLLSGLRAEPSVVQNDPPMSEGNSPLSQNEPPMPEKKENEKQIIFEEKKEKYDDERICERNYYTESGVADPIAQDEDVSGNRPSGAAEKGAETRPDEDDTTEKSDTLFSPASGQSYYLTVKDELERLFATGKRTDVLKNALPNSEWVEIKDANGCLVGQIYEDLQVRYIAYALPAREKTLPDGMEKACYIPTDPVHPAKGYYVLFQSAATGECVEVKNT